MILPTAEPFFIPGGSVGILLVHGFTGTPKEMRWMGEYLAEKTRVFEAAHHFIQRVTTKPS